MRFLSTCLLVFTVASHFKVASSAEPCSVYIAKASTDDAMIPVSMYAGIDFPANVSIGNPEMGIHLSDLQEQVKGLSPPFSAPIFDFLWTPSEIVSQFEDNSGDHGMSLISGMGFAGSNSPGLFNVRWNHSTVFNRYRTPDTVALDWRKDAMANAVSEFFGLEMATTAAIKAGSEIFPFFGDSWLQSKEEEAADDPTLFSKKNFEKAEAILNDYAGLLEKHKEFFIKQRAQDYWDLILNDVIQDNKVRNLLPTDASRVPEMAGKSIVVTKHPNIERSISYLSSNGVCMDNLMLGKSTIAGAGRGAFAKRPLAKGEVVAAAPLIRFRRQHFTVYRLDDNGVKTNEVEGKQVLLNYVVGHPGSSLLFYPYGTGVNFINHASYSLDLTPNVPCTSYSSMVGKREWMSLMSWMSLIRPFCWSISLIQVLFRGLGLSVIYIEIPDDIFPQGMVGFRGC